MIYRRVNFSVQLSSDESSSIREGYLNGIRYLIFPVVSLIGDTVVWPSNAKSPCFVPSDVISIHANSRNFRPILLDHPTQDLSGCETSVLESQQFGLVFNARYEDGKIKSDMWLDPVKAEKVSGAGRAIERLSAGEIVEVSEGLMTLEEDVSGIAANGQSYGSRWVFVIPDHLAILPEGVIGACSVDSGCGGNRTLSDGTPANISVPVNIDIDSNLTSNLQVGTVNLSASESRFSMKDLLNKFLKSLQSRPKELMMNSELKSKLWSALLDTEPGLFWVEDEDPEEKIVIYCIRIVYDEWKNEVDYSYWSRTYEISAEGNVTLNNDKTRVESVIRWEPVNTGDSTVNLRATRELNQSDNVPTNQPCGCQSKGAAMLKEKKDEIIARLRAKSPYNLLSEKTLSTMEDQELEKLDEEASKPVDKDKVNTGTTGTNNATATTPESTSETATVQVSEKELSALRSLAAKVQQQEEATKANLVTALLANKSVSDHYTEAKLKQKSLEDLKDLAGALGLNKPAPGLTDFSAIPFSSTVSSPVVAPKSITAALAKKNAATNQAN